VPLQRSVRIAAIAAILFVATSWTAIAKDFDVYAGPSAFGPRVEVGAHLGAATFRITYDVVGKTVVIGEVSYFKHKDDKEPTREKFNRAITIRTGNCAGSVHVRLKGIPSGSACKVTVE
jgi:hypothetical protein